MLLEIDVAINYLLSFCYSKLDREKADVFKKDMARLLSRNYEGHWYQDCPQRGSAYRALLISPEILDPTLVEAMACNGIDVDNVRGQLPDYLTVWIDPCEVSYRVGERGDINSLWQENQQQHLQLRPKEHKGNRKAKNKNTKTLVKWSTSIRNTSNCTGSCSSSSSLSSIGSDESRRSSSSSSGGSCTTAPILEAIDDDDDDNLKAMDTVTDLASQCPVSGLSTLERGQTPLRPFLNSKAWGSLEFLSMVDPFENSSPPTCKSKRSWSTAPWDIGSSSPGDSGVSSDTSMPCSPLTVNDENMSFVASYPDRPRLPHADFFWHLNDRGQLYGINRRLSGTDGFAKSQVKPTFSR